ncbi:hypothetical protein [Kingella sp. (in: b-proteobacteria)]|uniref:hypothetical protein n=1 Tax=Kingella sp. (in: b-proteobacteria) TaxID=2020713 RepID=UPI0026DAA497|nr:hypothetical protein [Kingella sp. (in: b-proteobacteria)]MDO4656401.1 hypothetical protein [Kingella sp. (in: b-proteobacteria)]
MRLRFRQPENQKWSGDGSSPKGVFNGNGLCGRAGICWRTDDAPSVAGWAWVSGCFNIHFRLRFRQPENGFGRRVGNGLPTECFGWLRWASELPALRLNAGAMVRQPETAPRAPTACLQAVLWLKTTDAA